MMVLRKESGTEAKLEETNSCLEWSAGHMLHEREILIPESEFRADRDLRDVIEIPYFQDEKTRSQEA